MGTGEPDRHGPVSCQNERIEDKGRRGNDLVGDHGRDGCLEPDGQGEDVGVSNCIRGGQAESEAKGAPLNGDASLGDDLNGGGGNAGSKGDRGGSGEGGAADSRRRRCRGQGERAWTDNGLAGNGGRWQAAEKPNRAGSCVRSTSRRRRRNSANETDRARQYESLSKRGRDRQSGYQGDGTGGDERPGCDRG